MSLATIDRMKDKFSLSQRWTVSQVKSPSSGGSRDGLPIQQALTDLELQGREAVYDGLIRGIV